MQSPKLPIVVLDDTGALGNRVVTHIYALALAAKAQTPLVNLCLWRYRRYLVGGRLWVYRPWLPFEYSHTAPIRSPRRPIRNWLRAHPGRPGSFYRRLFVHDDQDFCTPRMIVERALGLLLRKALRRRWVQRTLHRWLRVREYYLDDHKFVLLVPNTLPEGLEPSRSLAMEMEPFVKPYVRILPSYVRAGEEILRRAGFNGHHPIVGVHVRRGDYKVYRGGKWWFSDEAYADCVHRIAAVLPERAVRVLLVSQAPLTSLQALIPSSRCISEGLIEDFCALGACDIIIAPPSTYSGLASYLFEKPLYQINSERPWPAGLDEIQPWQPRWH